MPSNTCGAPVRYWRVGMRMRVGSGSGTFQISEFALYDSRDPNAPNLLSSATMTVAHIPGSFEVTAPLDPATNTPILDGAVLIDGDTNTYVEVSQINAHPGDFWYIDVDFGAGNGAGICELGWNLQNHFMSDTSDWELLLFASQDATTWTLIDHFALPPNVAGLTRRYRIAGHGESQYRRYLRKSYGQGFITGIVSEDSAVKPLARVFCFERDTMTLAAEALTDGSGTYTIWGLDTSKPYLVLAVDDDGSPTKQPVAWDHVIPNDGRTSGQMAKQGWANRQSITNMACRAYFRPGLTPYDEECVGICTENYMAAQYAEPHTTEYGVFSSLNPLSPGTLVPLKPSLPSVLYAYNTWNRAQFPFLPMGGSNKESSDGFALEVAVGLTGTHEADFGIFGFPRNSRHWLRNDARNSPYLGRYQGDRSTHENAYLIVRPSDNRIRYLVRFASAGLIDRTIDPGVPLNDGKIHHIVLTVTPNGYIDLYLDGVQIDHYSVSGSGQLIRLRAWDTAESDDTSPIACSAIKVTSNPSYNYRDDWAYYLAQTEISLIAFYNRGLTSAEVAELYTESTTETYSPATSLPGITGYEASVLQDAPALYWPMQDAPSDFTSDGSFPLMYPFGQGRVATVWGDTPCTINSLIASGSLNVGSAIAGTTRMAYSVPAGVTSAVNPKVGMIHGPGISNPKARTFELWTKVDAAVPSTATLVRARYQDDTYYGGSSDFWVFQIELGTDGRITLRPAASNRVDTYVVTFNYVLPYGALKHIVVRYNMDVSPAIDLFIDGVLVESQNFAVYLWFGGYHYVEANIPANLTAPLYLRDFAIYDYALPDDRIAAHYSAGAT